MVPLGEDFEITDPIVAAEEAVAALRDRDVDHVIALSHTGDSDEDLAAAVDIDAILGCHLYSERIEHRHGTLLTRPGATGAVLLEATLSEPGTVTRHEVAEGPLDTTV